MKTTAFLAGLSAFTLGAPFLPAVEFKITGATAFRAATVTSIIAKYNASAQPWRGACDSTTTTSGADRYIFEGKWLINAVLEDVTIRCSFNGSVEGINAIVNGDGPGGSTVDPTFLRASGFTIAAAFPAPAIQQNNAAYWNDNGHTEAALADSSFSDVAKTATPYSASTIPQPATGAEVGVVVFTMLTNEGAPAGLWNVSCQQARALKDQGFLPLSFFTGVEADDPYGDAPGPNAALVFAIGRNDGSGTRTTELAEVGFGIQNLVKHYVGIDISPSDAIEAIQLVPPGGSNPAAGLRHPDLEAYVAGGNPIADDSRWASTVWSNLNQPGNGGYRSGGEMVAMFERTSPAVRVFNADGSNAGLALSGVATDPIKCYVLGFLSLNDAQAARYDEGDGPTANPSLPTLPENIDLTVGGKTLAYDGYKLDYDAQLLNTQSLVTGWEMTATDKAKVREGQYTLWSYQQFYYRSGISASQVNVYQSLKDAIPNNLATAGLALDSMHCYRIEDGSVVLPL